MLHLANLLFLFAISFGIVAIYVAVQLYRQYGYNYLRSHIYMIIAFNIIIFSNIIESYLKIVLSKELYSEILEPYFTVILFILPVVLVFACYHFIKVVRGLLCESVPSNYFWISLIISGIFLAIQITCLFSLVRIEGVRLNYVSAMVVHFLYYFILYYEIGRIFLQAKKLKNAGRSRALKTYAIVNLVPGLSYFLITLAGVSEWISVNTQMLLLSIMSVIFFMVPVFFFRWFLKKYHNDYEAAVFDPFKELVQRHSISHREEEIIRLVCSGKTNKEIGNELFISPITVRDHLSNIFKKTGVKSRMQLSNVFRDGEKKLSQ